MRITLVQLSDIHFAENNKWLAGKLASAVWANDPTSQCYFLLFCGDVAYSGQHHEYQIAKEFATALRSSLKERNGNPSVVCFFIPGNHDCNFGAESDTRRMAVDYVANDIASFRLTGDIARACVSVQDDFFKFMADQATESTLDAPARFFYFGDIEVGGFHVRVNMYNTAWLSRKDECQGQLLFPVAAVAPSVARLPPRDLVIALLHHPYNWFRQDNARDLKNLIESSSDIIFTGHEHESSVYTKDYSEDFALEYIEGAVLQDHGDVVSGFNLIELDTDNNAIRTLSFRWRAGLYNTDSNEEWKPLRRNRNLSSAKYPNSTRYQQVLDDVGTGFMHSQVKNNLRREDLFLYPELRRRSFVQKSKSGGLDNHVRGKDVLAAVYDSKCSLISGAALSGKSTLARSLYVDLKTHYDLVPLLISGRGLAVTNQVEVERLLDISRVDQYGHTALPYLKQMSSSSRALIIDDFDHANMNVNGQRLFLDIVRTSFDFIIILTDEFFALEELSQQSVGNRVFPDFDSYQIAEFGYYLRGKLIEKWVALGREHSIPREKLDFEVHRHEQLVETVLGRNLLPSHPLTILTVLQAVEATKARDTAMGSYGYLYETLILHALSAASFSPAETDVVMAFLSLVAYRLSAADQEIATESDLNDCAEDYFHRYRIRLPQNLFDRLVTARVFFREGDQYKFSYPYYGYFFVASYLRDNIRKENEKESLRALVNEMADHIYYERYANTLSFYIYLTKDVDAINMVVSNARLIYENLPACDFDEDVKFVNDLYGSRGRPERLQLPKATVEENRDEYRQEMDKAGQDQRSEFANLNREAKIRYDNSLSGIIKINIANRTLQILGQIIRNSPGSLEGEIKSAVAFEAYMLGLRSLIALLKIPEENLAELRFYIMEMIKEYRIVRRRPALLDRDLATMADERIIQISQAMGYAMIRRISRAVGLSDLKETYVDVLQGRERQISFRLIDVAIQLDHFSSPSEEDLKALDKDLRHNAYSHGVLRDLVLTYLYLRKVDHGKRSMLMSRFNISAASTSMFIDNPAKQRRLR